MISQMIGSGVLALRDTANNAYQAGVLQGVAFDFQSDIKELIGDKKVAVLTAEVARKYKATAKFAQLSSALVGAVMGGTRTTGSKIVSTLRKTASASAITVATADEGSPAGWAFVVDLGVKYVSTGQDLRFNSGTLASTGEYKNTAAAYTLGSGDATAQVDITYVYSQTAGETYTANNQAIGLSTYFSMRGFQATTQADGTIRKIAWYFPAVLIPGLKLGFQNSDFSTQDLEMSIFADSSGLVAEFTAI
jgi:hypothetical protein